MWWPLCSLPTYTCTCEHAGHIPTFGLRSYMCAGRLPILVHRTKQTTHGNPWQRSVRTSSPRWDRTARASQGVHFRHAPASLVIAFAGTTFRFRSLSQRRRRGAGTGVTSREVGPDKLDGLIHFVLADFPFSSSNKGPEISTHSARNSRLGQTRRYAPCSKTRYPL